MNNPAHGRPRGSILIAFALFLVVLLGFAALATEAGRWYLVRAELSKSVDAAALIAAKNISNPFVSPRTIGLQFAQENFPVGYLGTPAVGFPGAVSFTVDTIGNDKVQVTGHVSSTPILAQLFGVNTVPTVSSSVAQKKDVEIMVILDRSGSMAGAPISDLKSAARTFVSFFSSTQDKDKMGMISFATSVTVDRPLGTNYVAPMTAAINALTAVGATNTEDAFAQAGGPQSFTDQTGVPGDRRIQQFLIFFSDGRPTAFRGSFLRGGTLYDGVACVTGNCVSGDGGGTYGDLGRPGTETWFGVDPSTTGNGNSSVRCSRNGPLTATTRWYVFDTDPVPGYAATANCIPDPALHDKICDLASDMAIQNANLLKASRITVYTIGLGANVNTALMQQLASSPTLYYHAPTSAQLQAIFQRVAQEIKLRLVQ
jgi:hypothetical protein